MNLKSKCLALLVATFFSISLSAQETLNSQLASSEAKPETCYNAGILLDPELPLSTKKIELAHLAASAESGDKMARYLLGSFYRLGENHPAKIFPQDNEKAKIYLSNAAIAGSYAAMAGMAELELKNKNYREAMLWAQVFAHYSDLEKKKQNADSNQAYQAYLIQRILQFTNKDKIKYSDQLLRDDLLGFHAKYNQKILEIESDAQQKTNRLADEICTVKTGRGRTDDLKLVSGPTMDAGPLTAQKMSSPGYAFYLVAIDSKGKVSRVFTADSMPDASYAKALAYVARRMKFNQSKETKDRYAYVPLSFDDFSVAFKKTPAKK